MPDEIDTTPAPSAETVDPATLSKFFTAEDIAKARQDEKAKLYPELEKYKSENKAFKDAAAEVSNVQAAQEAAAAEQAKKQAESEMDIRALMDQRQAEFEARLAEESQARENAMALLVREREFAEMTAYMNNRMAEEAENIMPELQDLVGGNTTEEIEASITAMKERTARIVTSVQSATQAARQGMAGTRITAPPAGPLDTNSENRSYTPDEIKGMSAADYAKNRARLLGGAAATQGRGIFG